MELYHHGIKGMRWGIRRFQNKDGSLTPAGEKRYADKQEIKSLKKERNDAHNKAKSAKSVKTSVRERTRYVHKTDQISRVKVRSKALDENRKIGKSEEKYYEEYKKKGYSDSDARIAAYRRDRTMKTIAALSVAAAAGAITYSVYKHRQNTVDRIIKKGTIIQNVSQNANKGVEDAFYFSKNKLDNMKYRGVYGQALGGTQGIDVYATKMRALSDLKVASPKSAQTVLESIAKSDKKFQQDLFDLIEDTRGATAKQVGVVNKALSKLRNGVIDKDVYNAMNLSLSNHRIEAGNSVRTKFYTEMAKRGYDIIDDLNDKKWSGYGTFSPMIAFNGKGKITVDAVSKLSSQKVGKEAMIGMGLIQGDYLVKSLGTYASAAAGASYLISRYQQNSLRKRVENYMKEHPGTQMTYDEIAESFYSG